MFIRNIHVSLCSINLYFENGPGKKCIWKRICQIHQIRRIKYKYKYKYMVWNLIKYKYKYAVFVFVFVFANTNTYLTPALTICCSFRTVAAREKYPGFILFPSSSNLVCNHVWTWACRNSMPDTSAYGLGIGTFCSHLPLYAVTTKPSRIALNPFNSLGPSDAIWRQRSGSTLAQVMACCLMAPSHYLNQCWLIISEVQWHSY